LSGGRLDADTIDHQNAGDFNFTGGFLHVHNFTGNLVNEGGILSPGRAEADTTTITGDYTQQAAGTLEVEIGGATPGTQHDNVVVGGAAVLDGVLHATPVGAFAPTLPGQSFTILTAASRTGTFDGVVGDPSTSTPGLFWTVSYTPTTAILSISALPGDIDLDGDVDRTDAARFTSYFGRPTGATWTTGDFNADGRATLADWALLQSQLGEEVSPSPSVAAIPEPATISLLLACLATFLLTSPTLRK
jgi:hypothetical protein